jgi:predicted HNH restriction endonuclease
MPRKNKYTKELLESIVPDSLSYAQVLRKLNLREAGGNYANLQKNLERFEIDTSHMLHEASNKGKEFKRFETLTSRTGIKARLIAIRGHKCEIVKCGLTVWLEKPICLELDHIDGNNRNNDETNLRLLCPNCHSQTPTWRNRKRK